MTRYREIDAMRFYATLLVVLGHVLVFFVPGLSFMPFRENVDIASIQKIIYYFHIPTFFFVSGMLYRKRPFLDFCWRKFKRLMIPFILCYFLCLVPLLIYIGDFSGFSWDIVLHNYHTRHLWFLYTLFVISILQRILDFIPARLLWLVALIFFLVPINIDFVGLVKGFLFFESGVVFKSCKEKEKLVFFTLGLSCLVLYFVSEETSLFAVGAAFLGIFALYLLAKVLPLTTTQQMGIYLYHVPFIYLSFYWCSFAGFSDWSVVLFVFGVGLVGGYLTSRFIGVVGRHLALSFKKVKIT